MEQQGHSAAENATPVTMPASPPLTLKMSSKICSRRAPIVMRNPIYGVRRSPIAECGAAGLLESAKPTESPLVHIGSSLMRLPFVAFCWLAAALSGAAAQTPTVAEQTPTVTGITITKVGPTRRRPTSAPARPGQDAPTGTVGTDVNWHFLSVRPTWPARPERSSASNSGSRARPQATA